MKIHQYKVKIQKIFIKNQKKNYEKKRKTRERERVITFLCDKLCIKWKRLANL